VPAIAIALEMKDIDKTGGIKWGQRAVSFPNVVQVIYNSCKIMYCFQVSVCVSLEAVAQSKKVPSGIANFFASLHAAAAGAQLFTWQLRLHFTIQVEILIHIPSRSYLYEMQCIDTAWSHFFAVLPLR
jgi:hypothetical protein